MSQASIRASAIAPLIEAIKRRQHLALRHCPSFFLQIGDAFTIGDEAWFGPAIISPDALFLLKQKKTHDALPMPGVSSETNLSLCSRELITLEYSELPGIITSDPNWLAVVKEQCSVAVLLRDETKATALVPFTSDVQFDSDYPAIRVNCGAVSPVDTEEHLSRSGWLPPRPPSPVAVVSRKKARWTPVVLGTCILLFVALTVILAQWESLSIVGSLLICIPLMGGLLAFLTWFLHAPKAGPTQP